MPRACRASNNSFGGIAVLTAKKLAADGTGESTPSKFCSAANSRSCSRFIFSTSGFSNAIFSSATSAAVIEKKFKLYGIFALLNSWISSGAAKQ